MSDYPDQQWKRPVLGVLLDPARANEVPLQQPGWELSLWVDAAEEAGLTLYYFTLGDVDLEQLTVTGWLRVDGEWQRYTVPWPDVFYDQAHKVNGAEARILNHLYEGSIPINSARTLGKWGCYDLLRRFDDTSALLPETVLYQMPDDLLGMMRKHQALYIKPEWGSNGQGIARAWATGDGVLGWRDAVSGEEQVSLSAAELLELIAQSSRRNLLIIQQGIPLFEIESRPTDIRVGMRKDGAGEWRLAYNESRIRIARPGAITTNWKRGSSWVVFPEGLDLLATSEEEAHTVWSTLQGASLTIARRLEESLGPLGELGLDLGFDRDRRLWLIEVNVMPNKSTYPTVNGVIDPVYTRTIAYATYLYRQWGLKIQQ